MKNGQNVLFDIDWRAQQIKIMCNYKLVSFLYYTPSKEVLLQRLISAESNEKIIKMRMEQFDKDILHWKDYDFVVVNEDLDKCYKEIIEYLEDKLKYNKSKIEKHINKLL